MKKRHVIKSTQLPTRLPANTTILWVLALDYWHSPGWAWGAVGLFLLIAWVLAIFLIATEEQSKVAIPGEEAGNR